MDEIGIAYQVERLVHFSLANGIIEKRDEIYIRNTLLDILGLTHPYNQSLNVEIPETIADILPPVLDYAAKKGIIPQNTLTYRDLFSAKIMGAVMPRPSSIEQEFNRLKSNNIKDATDWFYNLNKKVNYIQTDRINKNLFWIAETEFGNMEITVNLSKPEKDPNEIIAKGAETISLDYPKCFICRENEGFRGSFSQPAKQNLRLLHIRLSNEKWYFQYSPYVYYREHCIVLNENHTPMGVSEKTFERLFDFIDIMPHYFLGSNASIPIVGGSILSHDHYQGGRHTFPMEKSGSYAHYIHPRYNLDISLVKWPMPVIRVSGDDRADIIGAASEILSVWNEYNDENVEIISNTNGKIHNAITPIARINKSGKYELDIVLRNNRTSEEHPLGVFHPHENLHHIKKENIGLIEVMGLAILPGRLDAEMSEIKKILTGVIVPDFIEIEKEGNMLHKHINWIKTLIGRFGTKNSESSADKILKADIGRIFKEVLSDAGVFKYNSEGKIHFDKFMLSCGMSRK